MRNYPQLSETQIGKAEGPTQGTIQRCATAPLDSATSSRANPVIRACAARPT